MANNVFSIKDFMRKELNEEQRIQIPGVKTFSDAEGNPIPITIRLITTSDLKQIRKACHIRKPAKDNKGKLVFQGGQLQYDDQYDGNAISDEMIVQALVFPNMRDKELLDFYKCNSSVELVHKMFWRLDEYTYLIEKIQEASGIDAGDDEIIDEAKN